jgi:hypothetical protein
MALCGASYTDSIPITSTFSITSTPTPTPKPAQTSHLSAGAIAGIAIGAAVVGGALVFVLFYVFIRAHKSRSVPPQDLVRAAPQNAKSHGVELPTADVGEWATASFSADILAASSYDWTDGADLCSTEVLWTRAREGLALRLGNTGCTEKSSLITGSTGHVTNHYDECDQGMIGLIQGIQDSTKVYISLHIPQLDRSFVLNSNGILNPILATTHYFWYHQVLSTWLIQGAPT